MARIPYILLSVMPAGLIALQAGRSRELPLKYSGPPTTAAITAGDLMTRLYIFADDSMMGRQVGTEYNSKGTAYIEREARRIGLEPAGDSGTFFQNLPLYAHTLDTASTITVDGTAFKAGEDFVALSSSRPAQFVNTPVIFAGTALDTTNLLPADSVRGKVVLIRPTVVAPNFSFQAFSQSAGGRAYFASLGSAIGVIVIGGPTLPPNAVQPALHPTSIRFGVPEAERMTPITSITVTDRMAEALLGVPLESATKGIVGKKFTTDIKFVNEPRPGRNVVALVRGSDPQLRGEYVVIGAHNDHIGFRRSRPLDHDSIRAFNEVVRPQGEDSPDRNPTEDEARRIRAITDSLHALHGARPDSIYNGADDDGSGSVSVLEIAEAIAKGKEKPKRSILFVWHTGEEAGLWGSAYFTDHPTVPRDSIVTELNMDMVGRGAARDVTGEDKAGKLLRGGPGYLQLVGSRRLSTELGDLIESVNKEKKLGLAFDYSIDANGHPQSIYCRSDHYEYARYGIPIVFFTTGGHADYHEVTDEPQYIDYDRMAQVATLVYESALTVANLDHRIVVDKPKPDPNGRCVQ